MIHLEEDLTLNAETQIKNTNYKYKIQNIKQNHIGTQTSKIKISNYNINHTQDPTKDAPIIAVIIPAPALSPPSIDKV